VKLRAPWSVAFAEFAEPELRRSGRDCVVEHWIRIHWFELSALVLLALNLWFVIKVMSVLRAVQDSLILLARWLDIARTEIDRQPEPGNDRSKR
jgi:hypothetical protein